MSAAINFANNQYNFAYVGEAAWHGLGQKLEAGQSRETWAKASGLDFAIKGSVVKFDSGTAIAAFPGSQVLFRADTHTPLAIVSERFKVVQPAEVLNFFCETAKNAGLSLETAGVLFDGQKFFALARTGESFTLGADDRMEQYVLLATACDGSMNTIGKQTATRVVCQNTLNIALSEGGKAVKTSHRTTFNPTELARNLWLLGSSWAVFMEQARLLAETPCQGKDSIKQFLVEVFEGDPAKEFSA